MSPQGVLGSVPGAMASSEGPAARAAKAPPDKPVRLYAHSEDPCVRRLHVRSVDQVGLLFKLCELLTSHGIDIVSAEVSTEDGIVNNRFELHTSRPSDFGDATEWCKELEEFLARNHASGGSALEGSLAALSKRLSVNPDLLSVVSFRQITEHDGPPTTLRYGLELEGINQAGLLTYTALVLYRSGFSIVHATISTVEGHVSDTFELSATTSEAEHLLRSYLDVPFAERKETVPLPFHISPSDCNLEELMRMWGKHPLLHSPRGSFSSSPRGSRTGSFNEDDLDGWAARSRLPSALSDREEPTGLSEKKQQPGEALDGRGRHAASGDGAAGAAGGASQGSSRKRDSRRMSVHFANGDVYTGNCVLFEGGEKRHGLGTYVYSPGTHETYKQYRGQWREDKKHGYGVLFYRNGGVYVGQWENNQKHGLGVLLDNTGDSDATQMPTFRYEGQWYEDEPHGLGAEESEMSSYFGNFSRGKRQGRGVRMNMAKMGSAGCEVMDATGRCVPILDALEAEMQSLARSSRSPGSAPGREMTESATYHFANSAEAQSRPALTSVSFAPPARSMPSRMQSRRVSTSNPPPVDGLPWAAQTAAHTARGNSENESGSSEKNSGDTRSPMSARQNQMYRMDPTTPSEGQDTPMPLGGCGMKARTPQHMPSARSDVSPTETQSTPLIGAGASARLGAASSSSGRRERTGSPRSPGHEGASNSTSPTNMRTGSWHAAGADGNMSVEFSLWEENNLLSPPDTTVGHPIPEEAPRKRDGDDSRPTAANAGELPPEPGDGGGTEESGASGTAEDQARPLQQDKRGTRIPKVTVSEPWLPAGFAADSPASKKTATTAEAGAPSAGVAVGQSMPMDCATSSGSAATKKDSRLSRPVRTPLLWSEDELAAFITCLGVSQQVSERVQQRKLKGVVHLLEMTNSELRREFGLISPVERLMVRQSLKRLLDADRWENSVRGHKVGDILSDSVLSKFIVPLEELTLVTKISQGGYGTVYRGVLELSAERGNLQAHRSHLVAVKEMRGERRVRLYELLKEACVMASLSHPNICTFIGVCANAAARKHYIISELMDCSLFDLIHQPYKLRWHGELTVSLVVNLSKAICAGIVYLHGRNLVHADLKSSNILIDYSTSWQLIPRICDFGHAAVRTHPSPHHRCGTPHWAGPEVLRSEALGPAADTYSFGVIMWEMLAQKLPHKGLSFGQVLASVGWAGWTPDMSLLPEIPHELRRLLKECLSFSPTDRPTSKDVQRRLHRIPKQARLKALKMLMAFLSC